jgi:hypothetical protein
MSRRREGIFGFYMRGWLLVDDAGDVPGEFRRVGALESLSS